MTTSPSPLTGKPVRYDNIHYFADKTQAKAAMDRHSSMKLQLRLQFVGAHNAWIVEGHYKSDPYSNPYVLRTDNVFRKLHSDKVATR